MAIDVWIIYPRYVGERSDNAFDWLTKTARAHGMELSIMFSEDFSVVYGDGSHLCGGCHEPAAGSAQMYGREELACGCTSANRSEELDVGHTPCIDESQAISVHAGALTYAGRRVIDYPGFVVMRDYRWVLSRHFELRGIHVLNDSLSMMLCKNKMLTHQLLESAAIPTPLTIFNNAGEYDYEELCGIFGSRRFIVKRIDGAKGEGVFLVANGEELRAVRSECGAEYICQRFVEESRGRDVRVWVIGGKAAAAVLRYSDSSFKSNFSQGGKVDHFELTSRVSALAEMAAAAVGLEFAGVDLLFTDGGFTVCEVNGNAGFRTLSEVGENNIPEELFKYIANSLPVASKIRN